MVLRTANAVCEKRKIVKTIIIGYTTNLTVDINRFRKKYKSEDLKDRGYKWAYSRFKGYYMGIYIGMKLVLAISDNIHSISEHGSHIHPSDRTSPIFDHLPAPYL